MMHYNFTRVHPEPAKIPPNHLMRLVMSKQPLCIVERLAARDGLVVALESQEKYVRMVVLIPIRPLNTNPNIPFPLYNTINEPDHVGSALVYWYAMLLLNEVVSEPKY
jgi:hypothetical protein